MLRRFALCLLPLALATLGTASAQTQSTASARITATVQAALVTQHIPGAAVLILKDGKTLYARGFGYTTLTHATPVTPATHFEIGSLTKEFTAAAILQLRNAGKLSLNDRLSRFVPEYAHAHAVTLRQLLLQVSGIPDYTAVKGFVHLAATRPGDFTAILKLVNEKPLDFIPGTRWAYSNTNYLLLGRVIEVASGEPFDTYLRTHILQRVGMDATTTIADEPHLRAMGHGFVTEHGHTKAAPTLQPGWTGAAGDLVSTVTDLAKWDSAFFGDRILPRAEVIEATTPLPLSNGVPSEYAYGWMRDSELGALRIWHNGGTFGYNAYNAVFPTEHLAIIVLINSASSESSQIGHAIYNDLYPQAAAAALAPNAGEDPMVTAQARRVLAQMTSNTLDRTLLTVGMDAALKPAMITSIATQLQPLGAPTAFIFKGLQRRYGVTVYRYLVTYAEPGARLYLTMSLDAHRKVAGFYLAPAP